MNSDIEAVIQALTTDETGKAALQACETVETWARAASRDRTNDLLELAAALEERCDPSDETTRKRFEAVADHVEDQIALIPGTSAVDAVIALALRERVRSVSLKRPRDMRMRALASRLGYGQTPETLLATLERAEARPD